MGVYYGYNRTSTKEQHLDRGNTSITEFCKTYGYQLTKIYTDQHTGKNFYRPRYTVLKEDVLRSGDTLVIAELDRLGRNKKDIVNELTDLKNMGVRVMILDMPTTLTDFTGMGDELARLIMETINNLMIEMYATLAQAEIEKKDKRRAEGIEAMKARGEWNKYGRPRKISFTDFGKEYKRVETGEISTTKLMTELKMSNSTYYRYVREYRNHKMKGNINE